VVVDLDLEEAGKARAVGLAGLVEEMAPGKVGEVKTEEPRVAAALDTASLGDSVGSAGCVDSSGQRAHSVGRLVTAEDLVGSGVGKFCTLTAARLAQSRTLQ
jgi:hypothetical protein